MYDIYDYFMDHIWSDHYIFEQKKKQKSFIHIFTLRKAYYCKFKYVRIPPTPASYLSLI